MRRRRERYFTLRGDCSWNASTVSGGSTDDVRGRRRHRRTATATHQRADRQSGPAAGDRADHTTGGRADARALSVRRPILLPLCSATVEVTGKVLPLNVIDVTLRVMRSRPSIRPALWTLTVVNWTGAPRGITTRPVVITGSARVPLNLAPGVAVFTLIDSMVLTFIDVPAGMVWALTALTNEAPKNRATLK